MWQRWDLNTVCRPNSHGCQNGYPGTKQGAQPQKQGVGPPTPSQGAPGSLSGWLREDGSEGNSLRG